VRFNAEKKKVGNYYSTPVWSFRFKHTICGGWIEVRTDPQNAEYVVVDGGRRRDTGVDKLLDGEMRIGVSEEDKERLEKEGGFGALEKKVQDKTLFNSQKERLDQLLSASDRDWADPYEKSRKLRAEFRVGRRQRQSDERTGEALKEKFGLAVELLAEHSEDNERVKYIDFGHDEEGSTSSKPLFRRLREDLPARVKPGLKLDRKDMLQDKLRSNTRAATDPFLQGDVPWRPQTKRKRDDGEPKEQSTVTKMEGIALVGYDSDSS
jgi:coiled-coil domain-containing protein 130